MGLGKRQYRAIGGQLDGSVGPMPISIGAQMNGLFNAGFFGEYGGSQANLWVYRGALRIPAVYRATMLVSNLLAQSPWDAYSSHGVDSAVKVNPVPPLLDQPCPPDTRVTTLRSSMIDRIHDGNGIFIVAARDATGKPSAVWPVPASWVGVRRINADNAGTSMLPIGAIEYQVGSRTFSSDDVIHVKGPCAPGSLRGAGVLELFLSGTFETAHLQEEEAKKMARHGVPAGILKFTNDNVPARTKDDGSQPTMRERMRDAADQWLAARDHSGVAVMNSAVDFTPLAWNPDQMQMIQARELTNLQIANIMGVPPQFVGASPTGGSSLTYATSETGGKELLRDTMGIYFEEFEQTFSLALPRGTNVKFDREAFIQPTQLERFQAYAIGIQNEFLERSQAREFERWAPIDGIDDIAPTAIMQKTINKSIPITEEGLKQITTGDIGGKADTRLPPAQQVIPVTQTQAVPVAPVKATAKILPPGPQPSTGNRASRLPDTAHGRNLWDWLTGPGGLAQFALDPQPWAALRDFLIRHGVSPTQADGEATNIMQASPAGRALFAAHHHGGT